MSNSLGLKEVALRWFILVLVIGSSPTSVGKPQLSEPHHLQQHPVLPMAILAHGLSDRLGRTQHDHLGGVDQCHSEQFMGPWRGGYGWG